MSARRVAVVALALVALAVPAAWAGVGVVNALQAGHPERILLAALFAAPPAFAARTWVHQTLTARRARAERGDL